MTHNNDSNRGLSEALRALAREDDGYSASPAVEARLRAEVWALARSRRTGFTQIFAIAASLLLAVGSMTWLTTGTPILTDRAETSSTEAPMATAFLPLIHSQLSLAGTHIVRMELPRRALVSFGLAPAEAFGATGTVLTDVAVGDDGLARAVRFVQSR
jgi:hypothetical protein